MPDFRVKFPDNEVWTIKVKHKKGRKAAETLRVAHGRAVGARAAAGTAGGENFEDCTVKKLTAKLRAELEGVTYLTAAELLTTANSIGAEYQRRKLGLTVRGMYYQLVSRALLPSGQSEYNRVKKGLADARMRGDFPLGLLSDSSRTLHVGDATRYDLDNAHAILQATDWIPQLDRFFLRAAKWYRQTDLPIVLYEKEALSNAFGPTCRELGVSWMAVKGYPSVSTLFELHQLMARSCDPSILEYDLDDLGYEHLQHLDPGKRTPGKYETMSEYEMLLKGYEEAEQQLRDEIAYGYGYWTAEQDEEGDCAYQHHKGGSWTYRYDDLTATQWHQGTGQVIRLLYFGDHDPDGMEIPEGLARSLRVIQIRTGQIIPFTIERLGLNRDQILQYNPPPFWAKTSSSRHPNYIANHPWVNDRAWELDALDPTVLRDLTRDGVNRYFDQDIHDAVQAAVAEARARFNVEMQASVLPSLINP